MVVGVTHSHLCAVTAMWAYMSATAHLSDMTPLFMRREGCMSYNHMLTAVKTYTKAAGLVPGDFGAHSFRIGGSQALAAAGRSITYIMSYGRWRCTESVLRYVQTPLYIRMLDAQHMASASTTTKWDAIDAQVQQYYDTSNMQDKLWDARLVANMHTAGAH